MSARKTANACRTVKRKSSSWGTLRAHPEPSAPREAVGPATANPHLGATRCPLATSPPWTAPPPAATAAGSAPLRSRAPPAPAERLRRAAARAALPAEPRHRRRRFAEGPAGTRTTGRGGPVTGGSRTATAPLLTCPGRRGGCLSPAEGSGDRGRRSPAKLPGGARHGAAPGPLPVLPPPAPLLAHPAARPPPPVSSPPLPVLTGAG